MLCFNKYFQKVVLQNFQISLLKVQFWFIVKKSMKKNYKTWYFIVCLLIV
jgi:hypothetical protein